MCTLRTYRAGQAIFGGKLDMDNFVIIAVLAWHPQNTLMSLRAVCCVRLPIDRKIGGAKTLSCLSLPTIVGSDGTDQIDVIVRLTADHMRGRHIPCVKQLLVGQQVLLTKSGLNGGDHVEV